MTHEETQSPLADRQEHQARTGSSTHGGRSALGNDTQTIPSIIVTDVSPKDAFFVSVAISPAQHLQITLVLYKVLILSRMHEITPLQSAIDDYVPWFATDYYLFPDKSKGGGTVRGTVKRIYYFLGLLAGATTMFAAIMLLGLILPPDVTSLPVRIDQIWGPLLIGSCLTLNILRH